MCPSILGSKWMNYNENNLLALYNKNTAYQNKVGITPTPIF